MALFDFNKEVKKLKEQGTERLYYLYGEETYLRDLFVEEIKHIVVPDGDNGFGFSRFDMSSPDIDDIDEAVNAMPFLSETTYVEIKNIEINKYKYADKLISVLNDIPAFCTVVISLDAETVPDMRLKLNKKLKEISRCISFDPQPEKALITWIIKRFKAENKIISPENAEKMIFISGDNMNALIPEINKVSVYAKDHEISEQDIFAAAHHLPSADVFAMSDKLIEGKYSEAADFLGELISMGDNEPIAILSLIASQYKKLYAAKIARIHGLGYGFLINNNIARFSGIASSLYSICEKISEKKLISILNLCGNADYKMKTSAEDGESILKEVFSRIVIEVQNVNN